MIRFQVVDAADVSVGTTNLAQPRAPGHILSRFRIDPDIVDVRLANRDGSNPFEDIVPPRLLPTPHIRLGCARRKRIAQVETTISALPAFKDALLHGMSTFSKSWPNQTRILTGNQKRLLPR